MYKSYTFYESLKKGLKYQDKILNWIIEKYGKYYYINDVSSLKDYQEKDIDLVLINKKTKQTTTIEIKSDFTQYHNFYAEYISCERLQTEGCWMKTKADFILYFFVERNEIYILPTVFCQNILKDENYNFRQTKVHDDKKISLGYIIPINSLLEYISLHSNNADLYNKYYDYCCDDA